MKDKVKNDQMESREMATSPVPSIQSTQRKSRTEKRNYHEGSSSTNVRKKNWRSPSNPIEFMNCVRQENQVRKGIVNNMISVK